MTEATWALVGVTFLLALVAGWYAFETRRIVRRMDAEREDRIRPLLGFALIPWQPTLIRLRIQNLGYGPALDVKGHIEAISASGNLSFPWSYPLLAPTKYEDFGFPAPPGAASDDRFRLDIVRMRVETVRAEFSYKSVSGCEYRLSDAIPVTEVTEDWISSRMMATEDHPDRLVPRIAKALEGIEKHMKTMGG